MQTLPCSTCNKQVNLSNVKYFTANKKHVFCDAYSSFEWYNSKRNQPKAGDEIKTSIHRGTIKRTY